jgi:hypothetical protein
MGLHDRTPDQRRASAAKGVATRRARLDKLHAEREYAMSQRFRLAEEVQALEQRLGMARLCAELQAQHPELNDKLLLSEEHIVAASYSMSRVSGVYFLIRDNRVVYVGQSVNVYSRLSQHKDKTFDRFAYVPCPPEKLNRLESIYIHVLKPELNAECAAPLRLDQLVSGM